MADQELNLKAKISVDTSEAERGFDSFNQRLSDLESGANKAGVSVSKLAAGNVVGNILSKAFGAVTNSLGKAISRVDTLANYGNVMQSLGYDAEIADASVQKLSAGIEGLPTALDDIVANTQQLTASMGDLEKATDLSVALNDMFNAGGQGAEAASRAFVQFNQMIAKGKVDMQSWMSVVQTAPAQVQALASSMLGAEANATDLYAALQSGKVSMDDLTEAVIRLDSEGSNGVASFHEQALMATDGIATNISNLKTAVTKGVANMITNFQEAASNNGLPTISQALQKLKEVVNKVFTGVNKAVTKTVSTVAPAIKKLGSAMKPLWENLDKVIDAAIPLAATFGAMKIAGKVTTWFRGMRAALGELVKQYGVSASAKAMDTAAEAANTAAVTANTAAEAANTVTSGANTAAETANTAASVGHTAATTAETTAVTAATVAQAAFNKVLSANPLGLVIGAVIGLVAAMKALNKIIPKCTPEQQELIDSYQNTKDAAEQNWEAIQDGRKEYKNYDRQLKATGDTQERITAGEQEAKDIAEARIQVENDLQAAIKKRDELKAQIDADPVRYDEVTGVNRGQDPVYQNWLDSVANVNELTERYVAMETEAQVHQSHMTTIYDEAAVEQAEIHAKEVDFEEWKQMRLEGIFAAETRALQFAVDNQTVTLDQLSEKNQETVSTLHDTWMGYYDASTEMFEALENKSDQSVQSMIDTLAYNQSVVQEFGANIDSLRTRVANMDIDQAAKDGLTRMLDEFETAGPEMAGKVDSIVQASDEQLAQLGDLWGEAPKTAKESYVSAMEDAAGEVAAQMAHIWAQPEQSVREVLNGTKWAELGEDCKNGLIESFRDSSEVQAMIQHLGIDGENALKGEWGISSPAAKFIEMGNYAVQGLANGIQRSGPAVSAVAQLAQHAVTPLQSLPGRFIQIGQWAAQGLANGLASMAGAIMSVASSIANSVSSTISSALKVGSPSKVLEKIGQWSGEGLVIGLEKMEKAVSGAADNLVHAAGQFFVPDLPTSGADYSLAIAGDVGKAGYSAEIDELRQALLSQPIQVNTTLTLDGKEVGRATAVYSRDEINRLNKMDNLRKGIR